MILTVNIILKNLIIHKKHLFLENTDSKKYIVFELIIFSNNHQNTFLGSWPLGKVYLFIIYLKIYGFWML